MRIALLSLLAFAALAAPAFTRCVKDELR